MQDLAQVVRLWQARQGRAHDWCASTLCQCTVCMHFCAQYSPQTYPHFHVSAPANIGAYVCSTTVRRELHGLARYSQLCIRPLPRCQRFFHGLPASLCPCCSYSNHSAHPGVAEGARPAQDIRGQTSNPCFLLCRKSLQEACMGALALTDMEWRSYHHPDCTVSVNNWKISEVFRV